MSGLTATIVAADEPRGEQPVTLRIVNGTDAAVELANPDLGVPAENSGWPFSVQAYRAAQLMSFGFLGVSVRDGSGAELDRRPVSTWSTPLVLPPVSIPPGATLEIVIPLRPFFELSTESTYSVTVEYGEGIRVTAAGILPPRALSS